MTLSDSPTDGSVQLDAVDRKIIAALAKDGRLSMTALADGVHISRAHCHARVQRLRTSGVITGFTINVDPVKLGLSASAHVILKLRQHNWRALRQKLLAIPEVWHVTLTGGPMDVILLVRARDTADLRRVVFDEIQPLAGVVDTQTFMIFDDQVSRSALE
ncbi:MAG TPA: Lrp/AsnC family transcriptional regulator [Yaniella sp.]